MRIQVYSAIVRLTTGSELHVDGIAEANEADAIERARQIAPLRIGEVIERITLDPQCVSYRTDGPRMSTHGE